MEKKTVWKLFWVWEFEKEEAWLNEMAAEGWTLCSVGFFNYTFERTMPEEYTVRLEMYRNDPDYLRFLEEAEVEYVGRVARWAYYRKRTEDGPFELFSDIGSRIEHLGRIGRMISSIGILNLGIGVLNSINGTHIGWINLLAATLLMYGLGRIHGEKEFLKREQAIRE